MKEVIIKEREKTTIPVIKKTEYVIDGHTGMRMTKTEWLEMMEAERDN